MRRFLLTLWLLAIFCEWDAVRPIHPYHLSWRAITKSGNFFDGWMPIIIGATMLVIFGLAFYALLKETLYDSR